MDESPSINFVLLTVALVFLLLVSALVDQYLATTGQQLVQACTIITVAVGLSKKKSSSYGFVANVIFLITIIIVATLGLWFQHVGLDVVHVSILIIFYLYAAYVAARLVLFTGEIDWNKIVGAICIYLLMGLIWAMCYLLVAQVVPGAFNGLEQVPWHDNFSDAAYYSFVTLTTLGYGDISPVAPIARFLVYMEAIFGVFYMAILVASLIGVKASKMFSD